MKTSPPPPERRQRGWLRIPDSLRFWASRDTRHAAQTNPFAPPAFPPGVVPTDANLAMDSACGDPISWAAQTGITSAYAEGVTFLGYAYLAALAQRAEHRVIVETTASEMTREWIEFEVATSDEDDKEKRPPGGLQPEQKPPIQFDLALPKEEPAVAGGVEANPIDSDAAALAADPITGTPEPPLAPETPAQLRSAAKKKRVQELEDALKQFHVREHFKTIAEQDGFFGRAHLYVDTGATDDRAELALSLGSGRNELSKLKLKKGGLKGLIPVEAMWAYPTRYESTNPLKPDWYRPQTWYVMGSEVHHTRLLTFVGRPVPDLLKPAYAFGGLAVTQMAKPYVDNWLRTRQSVSDLVHSFSVAVLKTNLQALLSAGSEQVQHRVELFSNLRDNKGVMLLGKDEEYTNVTTALSGLDNLQAQSQEHMASVARTPGVKLFGIQPMGLNASSEGEIRAYYDWIAAYQEWFFRPHLETVIYLLMLHLWGEIDEEITFKFRPLWQLDEAGEVAVEKTKADIDDLYSSIGVLGPEEIRAKIAADPKSPYHGIDPGDLPEPPPDPMGGDPSGAGGIGEAEKPDDAVGGVEQTGEQRPNGRLSNRKPSTASRLASSITTASAQPSVSASGGFKGDEARVVKTAVRYVDVAPDPSERCGLCDFFLAPNACERVTGIVRPEGWCRLYEKRDG